MAWRPAPDIRANWTSGSDLQRPGVLSIHSGHDTARPTDERAIAGTTQSQSRDHAEPAAVLDAPNKGQTASGWVAFDAGGQGDGDGDPVALAAAANQCSPCAPRPLCRPAVGASQGAGRDPGRIIRPGSSGAACPCLLVQPAPEPEAVIRLGERPGALRTAPRDRHEGTAQVGLTDRPSPADGAHDREPPIARPRPAPDPCSVARWKRSNNRLSLRRHFGIIMVWL